MTSASTSVPPHTLAWIYNPANNETIIYVNPTDRSLDVGDPGLLEIHLQGVVSVAESDFVYEPDAAAVAAALEGIDPALMAAIASDGTVLTTGSADAGSEREHVRDGGYLDHACRRRLEVQFRAGPDRFHRFELGSPAPAAILLMQRKKATMVRLACRRTYRQLSLPIATHRS